MFSEERKYAKVQAVLYTRVSSKEQEKKYSLKAQKDLLRDYASENGIIVVRELIDVESAGAAGRAAFGQMMVFLEQNPSVKHLLVEKTDRLYRNFTDYVGIEELDITVHLVKEREVLHKNSPSHAMLFHEIKVAMARHYLRNLSEEVIKGMNKKAAEGKWPSKPPIGYIRNTTTHLIEPDPTRAPLITRLYEAYDSGRYSLKDLVQFAAHIGLDTVKGGRVNKAGIHRILTNPIYTGSFVYKGRLFDGIHQVLVPPELYQRVQRRLKGAYGGTWTRHSRPFRGLVKCGRCGCSMTPDAKKGKYIYYRCTEHKGRCKNSVSEQKLTKLLADVVKRVQIPAEVADGLKLALKESYAHKQEFHTEAITKLEDQYHRVKRRLENAYIDKVDGRIEEDFWREKSDDWNAELMEIEAAVKSHRESNRSYFELGSQIIDMVRQASDLFEKQDNYERRRLVDTLVSQCTYSDETLCVTYRKPFSFFAEGARIKNKRGWLYEFRNFLLLEPLSETSVFDLTSN